jgi:hypothetical protein
VVGCANFWVGKEVTGHFVLKVINECLNVFACFICKILFSGRKTEF